MSNMNPKWLASLSQLFESQEDLLPMMEALIESASKRKKCGDSTTVDTFSRDLGFINSSDVVIPTYQDVFCVPKKCERDSKKLYGKKLLETYFKDQHVLHLANYREVRSWFKDYTKPKDLHHDKEEQEKVKRTIEDNHCKIKALKFHGVEYMWRQDDIYNWWLSSNQGSRKYNKKKNNMSTSLVNINSYHHEDKDEPSDIKDIEDVQTMEAMCESISSQSNMDLPNVQTMKAMCESISSQSNMELPNVLLNHTTVDGKEFALSEDEFYDDILDGTQFPCFKDLIEHGFSKRVKANPSAFNEVSLKSPSSIQSNNASHLHCSTNPLENLTRKSGRERKISEKMKMHLRAKNKNKSFVNKEIKFKVMKTNYESNEKLNTDDLIIMKDHNISNITVEEMETILLKYFEVETIEQMYMVLKASYHKIRKEESCLKDIKAQSLDEMRESLVSWIISRNKVKFHRKSSHDLSVEDVEILV